MCFLDIKEDDIVVFNRRQHGCDQFTEMLVMSIYENPQQIIDEETYLRKILSTHNLCYGKLCIECVTDIMMRLEPIKISVGVEPSGRSGLYPFHPIK